MSIEELETIWKTQRKSNVELPSSWQYWIRHARRSSIGVIMALTTCIMITVIGLALKIHRIWITPEMTWINSSFDLLISLGIVVCSCYGAQQYLRHQRELASLAQDPLNCMEFLIETTRCEIRDIKLRLPGIMILILGLVLLAKWQSVATGLETTGNAGGGVAMVLVVILTAMAVMYHRRKAFLEPRLDQLCQALHSFKSIQADTLNACPTQD